MKNIVIIGGSGGLGSQVTNLLSEKYNVVGLSSKDLNIRDFDEMAKYFIDNPTDVVLNFSGLNFDKFAHKITWSDLSPIQKALDVNLYGSVALAAACLPGMRERGYGRLIYTSSVLSTMNVMGTSIYSASKAFIDRYVKTLSLENCSKGVTVNSIQLGYMDGGLTYKLPDQEGTKQSLPMKRWGTVEEIVSTIEFIINTEYVSGANIALTGGL